MISKPLPKKAQTSSQGPAFSSTKKLRFQEGPVRQEIKLNPKSFNHQIIKNKKVSIWCWEPNVVQSNHGFSLRFLAKAMKFSNKIQVFQLRWRPYQQVSNQDLDFLTQILKRLPRLKSLSLDFFDSYSTELTDQGLFRFNESLKRLSCLENFSLSLANMPKVTDAGLKYISLSLKGLARIKILRLAHWECRKITDLSLLALGEDLKGLRTLENLYINFSQCPQITDKGVNFLTKNLKKLGSLQRLSLDFSGTNRVSNLGLEYIGLNLRSLARLQEICLAFCAWNQTEIVNVGLDILSKNLKELAGLVKLTLDFSYCRGINDSGMGSLARNLKEIIHLQELTLKLIGCYQVSISGGRRFVQTFKNHTTFPKIYVKFNEKTGFYGGRGEIMIFIFVVFVLGILFYFWIRV